MKIQKSQIIVIVLFVSVGVGAAIFQSMASEEIQEYKRHKLKPKVVSTDVKKVEPKNDINIVPIKDVPKAEQEDMIKKVLNKVEVNDQKPDPTIINSSENK